MEKKRVILPLKPSRSVHFVKVEAIEEENVFFLELETFIFC